MEMTMESSSIRGNRKTTGGRSDLDDADSKSVDSSLGETADEGSVSKSISNNEQVNHGRQQLASDETRAMLRLKIIVFSCLFLSMIAVAFTAYYMLSKQEEEEFNRHYHGDAHKVLSTVRGNLVRTLQGADEFAASLTSIANATNQTWPFVVIPDFAVRAEKIRSMSQAVVVYTYHFVKPHQREEWQNFTARVGKAWVDESIAVVEDYQGMPWQIIWNYTLFDVIHDYGEFEKENPGVDGLNTTGPWLPMWQNQPTIAHIPPYNW